MAKSKIHYDRDEFEEIEKSLQNIIVGIKNIQGGAAAIYGMSDLYTAGQALNAVNNLKNASKRYDDLLGHYSRMLSLLEETWDKFEKKDFELAHNLSE